VALGRSVDPEAGEVARIPVRASGVVDVGIAAEGAIEDGEVVDAGVPVSQQHDCPYWHLAHYSFPFLPLSQLLKNVVAFSNRLTTIVTTIVAALAIHTYIYLLKII
jgi:hypothetical protein